MVAQARVEATAATAAMQLVVATTETAEAPATVETPATVALVAQAQRAHSPFARAVRVVQAETRASLVPLVRPELQEAVGAVALLVRRPLAEALVSAAPAAWAATGTRQSLHP